MVVPGSRCRDSSAFKMPTTPGPSTSQNGLLAGVETNGSDRDYQRFHPEGAEQRPRAKVN